MVRETLEIPVLLDRLASHCWTSRVSPLLRRKKDPKENPEMQVNLVTMAPRDALVTRATR